MYTEELQNMTVFQQRNPGGQKARLDCIGTHQSVTVYLPRSFVGPIRTKTEHGSVVFSPKVAGDLSTFWESKGEATYFLGKWAESGYGKGDNWDGDELFVQSIHGKMKIFYSSSAEGESAPSSAKPSTSTSFWSKIF